MSCRSARGRSHLFLWEIIDSQALGFRGLVGVIDVYNLTSLSKTMRLPPPSLTIDKTFPLVYAYVGDLADMGATWV
jgi:hypothetical protein